MMSSSNASLTESLLAPKLGVGSFVARADCERLCRIAAVLLDAPIALVWLKESEGRVVAAWEGIADGPSAADWLAARLDGDDEESARSPGLGNEAPAFHECPLLDASGSVAGGVVLADSRPRDWSTAQLSALADLAQLAATALMHEPQDVQRDQGRAELLQFLNRCPTIVFLFDLKLLQPTFVNAEVEMALGHSAEQIKRMGSAVAQTLIHPCDQTRYRLHLERIRGLSDGEHISIDIRLKHADSSWRWFLIKTAGFSRDERGEIVHTVNIASDITDRKEAEVVLERYRLLSQNARDIILFTQAADGRIVEANQAAEDAYRLDRSTLLGSKITELLASGGSADDLSECHAVRPEGQHFFQDTHRRRDGSTFPVEVSSLVAEVAGEELVLSIVRDISDRVLVERAIQLEEERYRLASEAAFGICYEFDLELDQAYSLTERIQQYLGYPPSEIKPTCSWWIERIHPDDRESYRNDVYQARETKEHQYQHEYRLQHVDGRYLWVLDRGFHFSNRQGAPLRRIGCAMDITDRKHTETSIIRQGERLKILSATVGHLLGSDQPRQFISRLFAELADHLDLEYYFNYVSTSDENRLRLDSYQGLPPDFVECAREIRLGETVCGFVAQERTPQILEYPEILSDVRLDRARSLGMRSFACFPLLAGERLLGTLGFGSRKRERFSADEIELLSGICDQVGLAMERLDLLNQLRDQAKRLRENDRRKDEFLAMLAHELRNPLAAIQGARQLLEVPELPPDELLWSLAVIDRQVSQLTRLIGDLLDISRITSGKIRLRKEAIDLHPVIKRALDATRLLFQEKHQVLNLQLDQTPLPVVGDSARLEQILVNLLANASKYTEDRGNIWLHATRDDSVLVLGVRDDGVGIPQDMLQSIFGLFTQIDGSLDRSRGGLGIGLALVKSLAEMHGGTVSASSDGTGHGCEFTLRLPADSLGTDRRPTIAPKPGDPSRRQLPRTIKVLVADDKEDTGTALTRLLSRAGFETSLAFDGHSAMRTALILRPDVLLLDIGLPGINGYDLAELLIKEEGMNSALFIACTGYDQVQAVERSKAAGFSHHLVKPVDFDTLLDIISSAFDHH